MKDLKKQVEDHNKRAIEEQKQLALKKKEEEEHLKPYIKGLSDDVNVLTTECVVLNRGGNQVDWELGRRLIKVHFLLRGQFQNWLKENGITRYKAYRLIKEVQSIPDVDLKALSRKPLDALPEVDGALIEGDELGKKLETGEATPEDFARRSPADVRRLLAQLQKLKEEKQKLVEEKNAVQAQLDQYKLGTIDEQKIRQWLGDAQLQFDLGFVFRIMNLCEISEKSQADIYAGLMWFLHRILEAETWMSERYPKFDSYVGPDRGFMLSRMNESGVGKDFFAGESQVTEDKHGDTTAQRASTKKMKKK